MRVLWIHERSEPEGLLEEENSDNLVILCSSDDPSVFEEIAKCEKWRATMSSKIKSIYKDNTWGFTTLPIGMKKIRAKWIFKIKFNENDEVDKYKA